MTKRLGTLVLECVLDLGITVVYAVIVGFLIVGIVATDDAPMSLLSACLYAALLPGSAVALILVELAHRLFKDWREARRQPRYAMRPSASFPVGR